MSLQLLLSCRSFVRRDRRRLCLGFLFAFGCVHTLVAQPHYVLTDLGRVSRVLGANPETIPINASGQVAFGRLSDDGTTLRAVRYDGANFTDLGTLPGDTGSRAFAINDAADVAGSSGQMVQLPSGQWALRYDRVFVHLAGTIREIDVSPSGSGTRAAYGINAAGQVVGVGISAAFVWSPGQPAQILFNRSSGSSEARAINEAGVIVGRISGPAGGGPAVFSGGTARLLGDGGLFGAAECINGSGEIAGGIGREDGRTRAFFSHGGSLVELPNLPNTSSSVALAINARGECVGTCTTGAGRRAVLFANGTAIDLTPLAVRPTPGSSISGFSTLTDGGGINDRGQITGKGSFFEPGATASTPHAFLATPACRLSTRSVTAAAGSTVVLTAHPLVPVTRYVWRQNGRPIAGATSPTLVIESISAAQAGTYVCEVQHEGLPYLSDEASVAVHAMAPQDTGRLLNLSVLASLAEGEGAFTLGMSAGGRGALPLPLLVRAAGPALAALGVANAVADPRLEMLRGQSTLTANDDWGGREDVAYASARLGAFGFAAASRDAAALLPAVPAGESTVRVSATGAGRVLAEIYDAADTATRLETSSRLTNLSVLKAVGDGLTAGFVLGGNSATTVLIRGIGPSLAAFGVGDPVKDPSLVLHADGKPAGSNDDWGDSTTTPHLVAAFARTGAFSIPNNSKDAVLLVSLPPGNYSATVTSAAQEGGVALLELYEVR